MFLMKNVGILFKFHNDNNHSVMKLYLQDGQFPCQCYQISAHVVTLIRLSPRQPPKYLVISAFRLSHWQLPECLVIVWLRASGPESSNSPDCHIDNLQNLVITFLRLSHRQPSKYRDGYAANSLNSFLFPWQCFQWLTNSQRVCTQSIKQTAPLVTVGEIRIA